RTFARLGLKSIPMVAESGPIGGQQSHEFIILADTGESEVFCHRDYLDFEAPGADVNFDDVAGLAAIVGRWTSLYAATSDEHDAASEQLYRGLVAKGVDVLYDDSEQRPGAKFATADLIGVPWQVLVGPKGLAEGKVEIKRRADGSRELVSVADALARLAP